MADAKAALAAGEGANFEKFRDWIKNNRYPTQQLHKLVQQFDQ